MFFKAVAPAVDVPKESFAAEIYLSLYSGILPRVFYLPRDDSSIPPAGVGSGFVNAQPYIALPPEAVLAPPVYQYFIGGSFVTMFPVQLRDHVINIPVPEPERMADREAGPPAFSLL